MIGPAARAFALMAGAALALGACSGGDPAPDDASTVTTTPTASTSSAPSTTVVADVTTTTSLPDPAATVRVAVGVGGDPLGEFVGEVAASGDPFADFASCSGSREYFGAYALVVSEVDGPARAVSILTNGIVRSSGVHEAAVRIEVDDTPGSALSASGTVTIDDGYRTGSFLAFTAEGTEVTGAFECTGGADAQPLPDVASDSVPATIEAFALVRNGSAQRILGFATVADDASACDGGVQVADVDGSISSFELTSEPSLRVSVGDVDYLVDDVTVTGDETAGTFKGSVDGVDVDGAYRCTS